MTPSTFERVAATDELSALYYPFSRCVDAASLKHMLLLFDRIAFLDPVSDDQWRADLLAGLAADMPYFERHAEVAADFRMLLDEGIVYRIEPRQDAAVHAAATAASAISDLLDPAWTGLASQPHRYDLPFHRMPDGRVGWQVFPAKLPRLLAEALRDDRLQAHLIEEHDEDQAWMVSYAAGSAAAISAHFAVADAHGLAPITDSRLHHELLMRKLERVASDQVLDTDDLLVPQLANRISLHVLREILPRQTIATASIAQILSFRSQTRIARAAMRRDLDLRVRAMLAEARGEAAVARVLRDLMGELRAHEAEFTSVRDKVWPGVAKVLSSAVAIAGAGVLALPIGGPALAITATIATAALPFVENRLDLRAERNRARRSAAPAVSYLSEVRKFTR